MKLLEINNTNKTIKISASGLINPAEAYELYYRIEKLFKEFHPGEVLFSVNLQGLRASSYEAIPIIEKVQTMANFLQVTFANAYYDVNGTYWPSSFAEKNIKESAAC